MDELSTKSVNFDLNTSSQSNEKENDFLNTTTFNYESTGKGFENYEKDSKQRDKLQNSWDSIGSKEDKNKNKSSIKDKFKQEKGLFFIVLSIIMIIFLLFCCCCFLFFYAINNPQKKTYNEKINIDEKYNTEIDQGGGEYY